jgi:hypothetical protein
MKALSFVLLILWSAVVLCPAFQTLRFDRAETARVRAHLARVESALRGRDASRWTAEQRRARLRNLDQLHAYWTAGVFPHNHDFYGERMPYFIDRHGTRCAMAFLIEQSGALALVRRVAATANNARVRDLASDPELVAWLDRAGMTAAEAAWVQPEYPPFNDIVAGDDSNIDSYATVTAVTTAVGIASIVANLQSGWSSEARRVTGTLGFIAGFGGVMIGVAGIIDDSDKAALGMANIMVGALAMGAGIRNVKSALHDSQSSLRGADSRSLRLGIAPRLAAGGKPQLALSMRF